MRIIMITTPISEAVRALTENSFRRVPGENMVFSMDICASYRLGTNQEGNIIRHNCKIFILFCNYINSDDGWLAIEEHNKEVIWSDMPHDKWKDIGIDDRRMDIRLNKLYFKLVDEVAKEAKNQNKYQVRGSLAPENINIEISNQWSNAEITY